MQTVIKATPVEELFYRIGSADSEPTVSMLILQASALECSAEERWELLHHARRRLIELADQRKMGGFSRN